MDNAAPTTRATAKARGPYRPSQETRTRLLEAALALFAEHGFEATSTRQIAAAAGTALPAIAYHFGGKEQLHLACAEHVVGRYRAALGETLVEIAGRSGEADPEQARADLKLIVRQLAAMLLDSGPSPAWLHFMLREMTVASPSHALLYRDLWMPGLHLVSSLIAQMRGAPKASEAERARALLLLSQLSALSNFRRLSLEFLSAIDDERRAAQALLQALETTIDGI